MSDKYTHRERIEMIIKGEIPEDRAAASIWRHFYDREVDPDQFVAAMLEYQEKYDWDFMKINPRASYHVQDWGNTLEWSTDEFSKHRKLTFAVDKYDDWEKLEILPLTAPVLKEHLKSIRKIRKAVGPELPLFMTVFTPLSIARYLVGNNERLINHIKNVPDKILHGLEIITQTYEKYAEEIIASGADGLFFATTHWASEDILSWEEYVKFGRPFDQRVISRAREGLNLFHVCAGNNYLKQLSDYPAALINWDSSDPTNSPLDKAFEFLDDKVAVGGIDHTGWLKKATAGEVAVEVAKIKERMSGKRFIFGPGCTIDPEVPAENIRALRDSL